MTRKKPSSFSCLRGVHTPLSLKRLRVWARFKTSSLVIWEQFKFNSFPMNWKLIRHWVRKKMNWELQFNFELLYSFDWEEQFSYFVLCFFRHRGIIDRFYGNKLVRAFLMSHWRRLRIYHLDGNGYGHHRLRGSFHGLLKDSSQGSFKVFWQHKNV